MLIHLNGNLKLIEKKNSTSNVYFGLLENFRTRSIFLCIQTFVFWNSVKTLIGMIFFVALLSSELYIYVCS